MFPNVPRYVYVKFIATEVKFNLFSKEEEENSLVENID
jgi:hypothetical protein